MSSEKKGEVDIARHRFPFCIVWTPIPLLTWLFPFIGHMGIAMSSGVIRDFAGPYLVSEDRMAFGWPTRYWRLDPSCALGGASGWDRAVTEASAIYQQRVHNLFCDNCHSHVALALCEMEYGGRTNWNMVRLALMMAVRGRFVSGWAVLKTWLPFLLVITIILVASYSHKL